MQRVEQVEQKTSKNAPTSSKCEVIGVFIVMGMMGFCLELEAF